MKKMMFVIVIAMMLVGTLCGCNSMSKAEEANTEEESKSVFVLVEQSFLWKVVYHKDTKVMYVVSDGSYNHGTFTLLVNADGTPMIYEE